MSSDNAMPPVSSASVDEIKPAENERLPPTVFPLRVLPLVEEWGSKELLLFYHPVC